MAGRAHLKHTEGGDFRQATYRAVRQGLMEAESILLEPWYDFRLELPPEQVGRALSDLQRMGGQAGTAGDRRGAERCSPAPPRWPACGTMAGRWPPTPGAGDGCSCTAGGYAPCHNAGRGGRRPGLRPGAGRGQPGGLGVLRPRGGLQREVETRCKAHAHVDSGLRLGAEPPRAGGGRAPSGPAACPTPPPWSRTRSSRPSSSAPTARWSGGAFRPQPKPARTSLDDRKYSIQAQKQGPEYLLVDGYNIIFAWEELKAVARDNLDAARQMLMEVLSNYQGFKQNVGSFWCSTPTRCPAASRT